jgi:hypothetical protein
VTAKQQHRAGVIARDGMRCRLAELGGCRGRSQADHILKISALRRWRSQLRIRSSRGYRPSDGQRRFIDASLEQLTADPRNGWMLCTDGHHVPKDRGEIPTEDLIARWPVAFLDFIDHFDLAHLIHTEFGVAEPIPILRGHGGQRPGNAFTGWID